MEAAMFRSIRYKLIIFLLLATILPLGASIVITYIYTKQSITDRTISNAYDLLSKGKKDVETYFTDITNIPLTIYQNRQFVQILENGATSFIDENQPEIARSLLNIYSARSEIKQVHLYIHQDRDDYAVYNLKVSSRGKMQAVLENDYFRKLMVSDRYFLVEPTHVIRSYNNLSEISATQKVPVISFHHKLSDVMTDRFLGIVSIDIDLQRLQSIMERLYNKQTEEIYLLDPKGAMVYASESSEIGHPNETAWYKKLLTHRGHSFEWEDKSFKGVVVHTEMKGDFEGWQLVKRIPYSGLYRYPQEIALINIMIGGISLIVVVTMTVFISFRLTAPIKVLIASMKKVEQGDWKVDLPNLGNDELGLMGRHFTSMIDTINDLVVREYRLEIENKSNQLRVLQSQINPHFLYNALQSIGTLSLQSNAPEVYRLLTSLSSIMRYSMNMEDDVVPVSAELSHIESYLKLQKQRFGDRLSYEIEAEPDLLSSQMPKMSLQPIVENFFKHSFEDLEHIGVITVKVNRMNLDTKRIVIADNGKGVTEDELTRINLKLTQGMKLHEDRADSIGMKNIYDRLAMYYGSRAVMCIANREGGGFQVTLEIPISLEGEG
jgi:two-component system sensor histidine kinase YesM